MPIISTSCNRIIANHTSLVHGAAITASSQRPSTDVRLLAEVRAGGGRIVIEGAYGGAADTDIDVEVLSGTGGALTASVPLIHGVGNGELAIQTIRPAAVPETITFALFAAGHADDPAVLDFAGVQLAARAAGAGGNAITLSIARALADVPTQYSTLDAITAGTAEFQGAEWDWGQPPSADDGVPAAALRVRFEGFPTVHRAWKAWAGTRFVYKLDPAPAWDVPAGTKVFAVVGGYTLTLALGAQSEIYTAVTVHDFLSALAARSEIVDVVGVIAPDRAPGGMAVTDIPLRTDAHALPARMDVRSPRARGVAVGAVAPDAPTELVTLLCNGADEWSVSGSVSGTLPAARTGVEYAAPDSPVVFTVPALPGAGSFEPASYRTTLVARTEGQAEPSICLKPLRLGVSARTKTVTYTYRRRKTGGCECDTRPPLSLRNSLLGLEGGDMAGITDPDYRTRLALVYAWREAFVRGNTLGPQAYVPPTYAPEPDPSDPDPVDPDPVGTQYWRIEADLIGRDGVVCSRYVLRGRYSIEANAQAGAADIDGQAIVINASAVIVIGGDSGNEYYGDISTPPNIFECQAVPGGLVVASPVVLEGASSGGVAGGGVWVPGVVDPGQPAILRYRAQSEDIAFADRATALMLETLGAIYSDDDARAAWDSLWIEVSSDLDAMLGFPDDFPEHPPTPIDADFLRRWQSATDNILIGAGLDPKSNVSVAGGDGSWRDLGHTHWWVEESGEYAPAFNNAPYYSATKCHKTDPTTGKLEGEWYTSQEFGFGLIVGCPDALREGDQFTVSIRGSGAEGAYQDGDRITIPLIAAAALPFVGGKNGDPTQTWTVRGSVSGALPDWLYNPVAPADYAPAPSPVVAQLTPAGIPFELGDAIAVSLEGGTLRWRRDGGAWATGDLFNAVHSLGDGLTLQAAAGAAPSFVTGDTWSFAALATYGVSRLRQPRIGRAFAFDSDGVVLEVDLGAVHDLEAVLIALHTLPVSATVSLTGGEAALGEWTATPAVRPGAILAALPAATRARYLRVTIAGTVTGASIGWLWAGVGWQPTVGASELTVTRQYGISRGAGLNPAGLYRGRGNGGRWAWRLDEGGALLDDNVDALLALVDHVAEQGLEPVCITPDIRDPAGASVAILDADELALVEHNNWQGGRRAVSVDLPFRAVLR